MIDREGRRVMFDQVAEEYDAVRPSYPKELFEMLADAELIGEGDRALELGCGTGQATQWLIRHDLSLTCIDPSENMLRIAKSKFAERNNLTFSQSNFEDYDLPSESLDLIVGATAWHWVDPSIGYSKAGRLLKSKGRLCIIANLHPLPVAPFFERIQSVYSALVPEWGSLQTNKSTEDVMRQSRDEMEKRGEFSAVEAFEYRWRETYSRERFLRLLGTYSDHRSLGEQRLGRLQSAIGKVIDEEFEGRVDRDYVSVAYVGIKG